MKKIALVCTTIGNGDFLDGYRREIEAAGLGNQVGIFVIPDVKTPPVVLEKCVELAKVGINISCPMMNVQNTFLRKMGMDGLVSENSDNRRNIGYLMALVNGYEVIVSIDDDNFAVEGSRFFQEHAKVGDAVKLRERESASGWYNVCSDLGMPSVYPRGFPYNERGKGNGFKEEDQTRTVAVNQGLWFGEPDLDAHTWIGNPSLRVKLGGKNVTPFLIGPKTWLPINSQNTAVSRNAMPAYYFIPMDGTVGGRNMDRMGDIFQGYFLETCVKWIGHGIRIGLPVVEHRRNSHNHSNDMMKEWPGIVLLTDLLPWLREVQLMKQSYGDCYLSLAGELEYAVETQWHWPIDARAYFHRMAFCMRQWVKACKIVG